MDFIAIWSVLWLYLIGFCMFMSARNYHRKAQQIHNDLQAFQGELIKALSKRKYKW